MKRDEGLLLGVLLLSALPSAPCFSTGGVLLRSPAFIMQMQQQDAQNPSRTALAVTRRVLLQGAAAFALTTGSVANAQPQVGWGEPKNSGVVKWGGGFENPLSNQGDEFTAEVVNPRGTSVFITVRKPSSKWKFSTNTGIAIQDYQTTESAYVVVAPAEKLEARALLDKVFDINGRCPPERRVSGH
ncbi:hypothetical protein T484DRAFT_1908677 [Baffinella frigidus]|nr:hypothetical protein T484DRAFT_1908677 [Cryptophyta sp. CCMP2293]